MLQKTHHIAKLVVLIYLVSCCVFFTGFMSKKYLTIGFDEKNDEFFSGYIDHNILTGKAKVFVKSQKSTVYCQGYSQMLSSKNGQQGKVEMTCTDGRQVTGKWVARNYSKGSGSGCDNEGNPFRFVFGFNEQDAKIELERSRVLQKDKPETPSRTPEDHP
jgi:hypothetical protein